MSQIINKPTVTKDDMYIANNCCKLIDNIHRDIEMLIAIEHINNQRNIIEELEKLNV